MVKGEVNGKVFSLTIDEFIQLFLSVKSEIVVDEVV